MIRRTLMKSLVSASFGPGGIDAKVADYVLTRVTRSQLKRFLFFLRREIERRTVYVRATQPIVEPTLRRLKSMYPGKEIVCGVDVALGGGIRIEFDSDVFDATIGGFLERAASAAKATL
jgi:hypothetical protein